jgi:hypothetical protein
MEMGRKSVRNGLELLRHKIGDALELIKK